MKNLIGQRVSVYFNLHTKMWSVRHKGKVTCHVKCITLASIHCHINENGRQRTISKKQKEVHAWINGTVLHFEDMGDGGEQISYNPYKAPHYYLVKTQKKFDRKDKNLFFNYRTRRVHLLN